MKFSTKLICTLVNATIAFAALNDKQQHDDTFNFWISGPNGGTATLVGLRKNPTTAKSLTIPANVYVEGIKFKVVDVLDHTFSGNNCPFEDIYVSSNVESFHFDHYSFNDCANLKRVVLYNDVITTELTAFKNVNKNVQFLSKGTKSFVMDFTKKLVRDLDIPIKNYSSVTTSDKKNDLFEIAKKLSNYLRNSGVRDSGNVAVNLVTKYGTSDGYARLFRQLAIAAGFPESDILVGGDNNGHYWNYVRFGSYWWNVDVNYPFRVYSTYKNAESSKPFFLGNKDFKNRVTENYDITVDPNNFIVWFTNFGYADEFRGQQTYENWDTYLRQRGGKRGD